MRLNQDFKEFLIALNKCGVKYLVIATPVVYSLLDDAKATARWRRFTQGASAIRHGIVERLKPRRKPRKATAEDEIQAGAGD